MSCCCQAGTQYVSSMHVHSLCACSGGKQGACAPHLHTHCCSPCYCTVCSAEGSDSEDDVPLLARKAKA